MMNARAYRHHKHLCHTWARPDKPQQRLAIMAAIFPAAPPTSRHYDFRFRDRWSLTDWLESWP